MTSKLYAITAWFVANPVRIRMVMLALVLALALVAILVPSMSALAGDAPGGGH